MRFSFFRKSLPYRPLALAALVQVLVFFFVLASLPCPGLCQELILGDFSKGIPEGWKEHAFVGHTRYAPGTEDGIACLRAESDAAASALIHEVSYNLTDYPYLSFSWKVGNTVKAGDEKTKQGDDYAARIYLVFKSFFFFNTKSINYIWANKLPLGQAIPNAYTKNVWMVAVESGPENVGQWRHYTVDVLSDYRRLFKTDPPPVAAVAIMTDTDNTKSRAAACYGPIRALKSPPEKPEAPRTPTP
ncbi:MAG: DUF3047 domain-containing protein [Thermodesulfobacteriota bacterium]